MVSVWDERSGQRTGGVATGRRPEVLSPWVVTLRTDDSLVKCNEVLPVRGGAFHVSARQVMIGKCSA